MKYRAEMIVWAYTDEDESLGCVYESESRSLIEGDGPRFFNDAVWNDIEKAAEALVAIPSLYWGINDFYNKPVPGTRAANEKNSVFYFLQKKKIKWWWFQKLFGYYVVGPHPSDFEIYNGQEKAPHPDTCRCVECEGR